jgi:lipopolysaccharide heptosyltransferase II
MVPFKKVKFKSFGRKIKRLYYQFLGYFGNKLLLCLRSLALISKPSVYSKLNVRNILIIRMDRIGDVVLSTPILRAVREHFPQASISLLVRSYTLDLVINNPNINEVIAFDDKCEFFVEFIRKVKLLRKKNFDLAIVLHPNFWVNFFAFASKARYRLGYDAAGSGFFLTMRVLDTRMNLPRHEVEVGLDVVRTIGIDTNNRTLDISVTEEGEKLAQEFLESNGCRREDILISIHPGGFYPYTHWLVKGFAAVADELIDKYMAKILIVGNISDRRLAGEIASLMKNKPIISAGKTTLSGLISLIKRSKLFIGNSSGPMHIACGLKVPVVAIFGNIHPVDNYQSWGPWGEGNIIISKNLNCEDCQPGDCLSLECMKAISPDEVLKAVDVQLNRIISK